MATLRQDAQELDWKFSGYIAKYMSYGIIVLGTIVGVYRYFILKSHVMELIATIVISFILAGLGIAVSWILLPAKK